MKKKLPKSTPKEWVVVHWISGDVQHFGKEKDCKDWAKKNSFNKDAPIYYAFPVKGLVLHTHQHEHQHTHVEKKETQKVVKRIQK